MKQLIQTMEVVRNQWVKKFNNKSAKDKCISQIIQTNNLFKDQ